MWGACAVLSVHMAIRSKAMLRAWIDPATTTCLFIDRSPGFHCCTDAPRPLLLGPSFLSLSRCLSHAPCSLFVTMWETALFNIPLPMSGMVFLSTKKSSLRAFRLLFNSSTGLIKAYPASGAMDSPFKFNTSEYKSAFIWCAKLHFWHKHNTIFNVFYTCIIFNWTPSSHVITQVKNKPVYNSLTRWS